MRLALRRDLLWTGIIGLLGGVALYAGASVLSTRIPILVQGTLFAAMVFACLLLLALLEVPMMVFGLRQMARSASTPRRLLLATFVIYVAFAAFYASMFVLLTGQIAWGLGIAAVCLLRLVSGRWVE
jgi:hypothetical protein